MRSLVAICLLGVLAGCSSGPGAYCRSAWAPTPDRIREAYSLIENPYQRGGLAAHAYAEGFLRAYSLGPAAVGTLLSIPAQFSDRVEAGAFRAGWEAGGLLAWSRHFSLPPVNKENKTDSNGERWQEYSG